MDASGLFKIANTFALLCWLLLLIRPQLLLSRVLLFKRYAVLILAVVYTCILAASWGQAEGNFNSLAGVMQLFTYEPMVLAGWIHYLAFDLFVGIHCQSWFMEQRSSYFIRTPILFATFMFGPFGYLLFHLYCAFKNRGHQS